MSYNSAFSEILRYQPAGEMSLGSWLLMACYNAEWLLEQAIVHTPSEPMEHVHAYRLERCRYFASLVFAQDPAPVCTPSAEKAAVADLPVPAVAGPGVCIPSKRLANLDCQDKLVKRGRKVSYQGLRGLVARVSRGRCLVGYIDAFERFTGRSEWVICERLQVVA